MRQSLDLTGQKFGRLTILRRGENIGNCTIWGDCRQETFLREFAREQILSARSAQKKTAV